MKNIAGLFIVSSMFLILVSFTASKKERIQWLTVKELHAVYSKNPKPVLVDVYTGWCGWCKVMERDTYSNEQVAAYINDHYYAVKLNAESKDLLEWDGKKYTYNPAYKANELAVYLTYGQMSYPNTVFLSTINSQPAPLPGYLTPGELEAPLKYFGDGAYKKQDFPDFRKNFSSNW